MNSIILYAMCVLVWGSSWFAIRFQVIGDVPALQTVLYRFALAALIMFAILLIRGRRQRYSLRDHLGFALMGLLMFSLNYLLFYIAIAQGLTTGLEAVIFSTLIVGNVVNARLFFAERVTANVVSGAVIGLAGILLLFSDELRGVGMSIQVGGGIVLAIVATYIASLGNMVARKLHTRGVDAVDSSAWGMGYGTLYLLVAVLAMHPHLRFSLQPAFLSSLGYLAVFASVIAFWAYLTLLGKIGSSKAAYATILFPIVALLLSSLFEGYQWNGLKIAGIALAVIGNMVVLGKLRLKTG